MPLYAYKAIDADGKAVRGSLHVAHFAELELRLRHMELDLIDATESRGGRLRLHPRGTVRRRDLIEFCFHLEQLSRAGVPLMQGLADLREATSSPHVRTLVTDLAVSVQGGRQLSEALALHPTVFDAVFVSLIAAGEHSGRLTEVLHSLTDTLKWQDELAAQTRKLLTYPAVVGATVLAVTAFLMVYLVPQLTGFIRNLQHDLPWHTRLLLAASDACIRYWYLMIGVPVAAALGIRQAVAADPGLARRVDALMLRIWLLGPVLRKIVLARVARFLALLYASGIPFLQGISLCRAMAGNRAVAEALDRCGRRISEGRQVSSAFREEGLFPPLVLSMLRVGETTGELDSALLNVSYFYDREVKEFVARAQALVEPLMTLILGAILAWVLLSVLGPVYDIVSRIGVIGKR